MEALLDREWQAIVCALEKRARPFAFLLHGSRAPGWPEPPLPHSDYDIMAVAEVSARERRRESLWPGSPIVDLLLVSRKGVWVGQLLSPETHVMLRYGVKLGDWSWCDLSTPLSWIGADDAVEEVAALVEAVELNMPENSDTVCRLGVDAVRKALILGNAVGVWDEAPTWRAAARRYGLPWEMIMAVRQRTLADNDGESVRRWAEDTAEAARQALADAREIVAGYGCNSSDTEVERLLVASGV